MMPCVRHHRVTRSTFTALKTLCVPLLGLPPPESLASPGLSLCPCFSLSWSVPELDSQCVVGLAGSASLAQSGAFQFLRIFLGADGSFLCSAESCFIVRMDHSLSIHPLKDILVASKFGSCE